MTDAEVADAAVPSTGEAAPGSDPGGERAQGFTHPVRVRNATVSFGEHIVLDDMTLDVRAGEIVVVIGPSGCGKSTLLNIIAGLVRPTSGEVECLGKRVERLNRDVGYMTQKDTLLPWRSAIDNVALPLEIQGVPKRERRRRAAEELLRVGIEEAAFKRRPHQLSGGMRSRVSLARSLLSERAVMLMDEPFAAIDALLRVRLQQLLMDVWERTRNTIVYVTHDLHEAISLAHRIVVLGHGRTLAVRKVAVPHPRDVASFRSTDQAQALYSELWELLSGEVDDEPPETAE